MNDSHAQVDLDQLIERKEYELVIRSIETVSQQDVRVSAHNVTTANGRRLYRVIQVIAAMAIMTIVLLCVWLLLKESPSSDETKWATTTLSAVIGGIVGFWTATRTRPAHR